MMRRGLFTRPSTQGATGATGATGPAGPAGADSTVPGPAGPSGITPALSIGVVSTVASDQPATATFTGTAVAPVLNLNIPRGAAGAAGATGPQGAAGTNALTQIEYRDGIAVPPVLSLLGMSATVDVTVTWSTPFPDTNYIVTKPQTTPVAASVIGKTDAVLKSKTTTGCVVTVTTTALLAVGNVTLSVLAYRK